MESPYGLYNIHVCRQTDPAAKNAASGRGGGTLEIPTAAETVILYNTAL